MFRQQSFPWYTGPIVGPVVAIIVGVRHATKRGANFDWEIIIALAIMGFVAGTILALRDLLSPSPGRKSSQEPLRSRQRLWYWLGIVLIIIFGSCSVTAGLIIIDEGISASVSAFMIISLSSFVIGFWLARCNRGKAKGKDEV